MKMPINEQTLIKSTGGNNSGGSSYGGGAGIGCGGQGVCSNITINGGTIVATGHGGSSGIGIGKTGTATNVIINGGDITANGGSGSKGIYCVNLKVKKDNVVLTGANEKPVVMVAKTRTSEENIAASASGKYTRIYNPVVEINEFSDIKKSMEYPYELKQTWDIKKDIYLTEELEYYSPSFSSELVIKGNNHKFIASYTSTTSDMIYLYNQSKENFIATISDLEFVSSSNNKKILTVQHSTNASETAINLTLDNVTFDHTNSSAGLHAPIINNGCVINVINELTIKTGINSYGAIDLTTYLDDAVLSFDKNAKVSFIDNRLSSVKLAEPLIGYDTSSGSSTDTDWIVNNPEVANLVYVSTNSDLTGKRTKNGWDLKKEEVVVVSESSPVVAPATKEIPTVYIGETKPEIKIDTINNIYVTESDTFTSKAPIIIENNRTFLGIRDMAYALGVAPEAIKWNDATKTATISKSGATIEVTQGSKDIKLTYKGYIYTIHNDVSAINKNDRIYLPFRVIFELFGYEVNWDNETRTITCK